MAATIEHVDMLVDHWWWRPGWRTGRHFHACHFTMQDQPELRRLVGEYQVALGAVMGLDPIPQQWLHLTMQGIGFVDDIAPERIANLRAVAAKNLASTPAPVVTFHRPVIRPEAVYLPAEPPDGIRAVRLAVRDAVAQVLGDSWLADAETLQSYRPHVSIAYSNTAQSAQPILDALAGIDPQPVSVQLRHVDLLAFHRDRRMYEWSSARPLVLGEPR